MEGGGPVGVSPARPLAGTEAWATAGHAGGAADVPEGRLAVAPALNAKLRRFLGHPWKVAVDAVVHPTTERIELVDAASHSLLRHAGPALAAAAAEVGGCRTGAAVQCDAGDLAAKHVVFAVGPRFSHKYVTAAENALCHCYRAALELACKLGCRSVALPCLYVDSKGYPRDAAAHVALRTLRRFLEKWGDKIDAVVLCTNRADAEIYNRLLPAYFPRDAADLAVGADLLPENLGNDDGELELRERDIRVIEFPGGRGRAATVGDTDQKDDLEGDIVESLSDVSLGYGVVSRQARLGSEAGAPRKSSLVETRESKHPSLVAKARTTELSDMEFMNILYVSGSDLAGRPLVTVVGAHLEVANRVGLMDRFLLHAVKVIEQVSHQPYSMLYYHSSGTNHEAPSVTFLRKLHAALGDDHKDNLKVLYVVHPTISLRLAIWAMVSLKFGVSHRFFSKTEYISKLSILYTVLPLETLSLPEHVVDHDKELWGAN